MLCDFIFLWLLNKYLCRVQDRKAEKQIKDDVDWAIAEVSFVVEFMH